MTKPRALRGWRRLTAGALAVLVMVGLSTVVLSTHHATPAVDSFYAAPTKVPSGPGRLLRTARYTRGMPATARAWRILYTTTRANGTATVASGFVLIGDHPRAGARPVLAWAHGTSGYARDCAPTMLRQPFGSGIHEELRQIIRNHWVLVATDYEGMGVYGAQPYLIGSAEGRAVLDAVRAVRQMRQVSTSKKTVVWGHSQGGGAALWADKIQPNYAPDVPLSGVAAISPTSDMTAIARYWSRLQNAGSVLTSYLMSGYAATYADVRTAHYVGAPERRTVRRISQQCLRQAERVASTADTDDSWYGVLDRSPDSGPLAARLRQNTPTDLGPAPLLVAWGGADGLIPASIQRHYVSVLCSQAAALDYQQYPGRAHDSVLQGRSPLLPELIRWTVARLAGTPASDRCGQPPNA